MSNSDFFIKSNILNSVQMYKVHTQFNWCQFKFWLSSPNILNLWWTYFYRSRKQSSIKFCSLRQVCGEVFPAGYKYSIFFFYIKFRKLFYVKRHYKLLISLCRSKYFKIKFKIIVTFLCKLLLNKFI